MKIGILIIGFNRPIHIQKVFYSVLKSRYDLSKIKIFVSLDGPKNEEDKNKSEIIYHTAKEYFDKFENFSIDRYQSNLGLRKHVLLSVSKAFEKVDALIVLEDDILIDDSCLSKTIKCFKNFNDDKRIGHINFINENLSKNESLFSKELNLLREDTFTCWGWGSWKHKWRQPVINSNSLKKFGFIKRLRFNHFGKVNHISHLYSNIIGENDTWAVNRKFDLFVNLGLVSITFKSSKAKNIGFDGSGSHDISLMDKQEYSLIYIIV